MSRRVALAVTAALVASSVGGSVLASPLPAAAAESPSVGATVVVGGGDGWSGPASRARLGNSGRLALASDGATYVVSDSSLLRVDPSKDAVSVVSLPDGSPALDVSFWGSSMYVLTGSGLERLEGTTWQRMWTGQGRAVSVGFGGVAWVATSSGVIRVTGAGTASTVPGTSVMDASDIAASSAAETAYVLDHADQRHGIYEVTASGVGARVAGTGYRSDSLLEGVPATQASMEAVGSFDLDGNTITVSSGEYRRLASFPIGGTVHVVAQGDYSYTAVATRGGAVVATQGQQTAQVVRVSGTTTTRILGQDPAQPWSPDGVRAADAYTDAVRGSAPIDGTRLVFTTASGRVREVTADGTLRTRADLPTPLTNGGKVAVGGDGTAYLVNDSGRVVKVTAAGSVATLAIPATATDVEVLSDGRLVVADAAGKQLLVATPDGSSAKRLAALTSSPTDLGLDSEGVLVADEGLRRVALDGTVTTLLSGGQPTAAAKGRDGLWAGKLHAPDTSAVVLAPDGGIRALRAVYSTGRQVQADATGAMLVADDTSVSRVTDGGTAPARTAPAVTAAPGEGRVTLTPSGGGPTPPWVIRAKRGTEPPRDMWDGVPAGPSTTVFRVGDDLIPPGEQWTFAVFEAYYSDAGNSVVVQSYTPAGVVTSAAEVDPTPPPLVGAQVRADHVTIQITYTDPNASTDGGALDFDHTVVRYAVGSTPPATPLDGTGIAVDGPAGTHAVAIPDPVRGQTYAVSIFAFDLRGNYSRWTALTELDFNAPPPPTDVVVQPSYRQATVTFTPPTTDDYTGVLYVVAPGTVAPAIPDPPMSTGTSGGSVVLTGLKMDTEYTVSLASRDLVGNISDPVPVTFRTLLDDVPPEPVTGLVATGGSYSISASWTKPTAIDVASVVVDLVSPETGASTPCPSLGPGGASCTWRVMGGATRVVRARAKDVNGNLSSAVEATATSDPDTNGTPSVPQPVTWTATDPTHGTVRFPRPTMPDFVSAWYALFPAGETTGAVGSGTFSTRLATVAESVTLPDADQTYDLVISIRDLNGNVGRYTVPGVHGGPDPSGRPTAPGGVRVTAPVDNTIKVQWSAPADWAAPVDEWAATATSADGSTVRTVRVPGTATNLGFGDLPGRQTWTVRVHGVNSAGEGTWSLPQDVLVGDSTAPAAPGSLKVSPSYDTATVSWARPSAFDLSKVVVVRRDRTTGQAVTIHSGLGTSARSTGLVARRAYTYEARSYDVLGNVSLPSTAGASQSATSLVLPASVRYGTSARGTGMLTYAGKPLASRSVSVFAQPVGSTTWSRVSSVVTTSTGAFAYTVKPSKNTRYRVGYAGAGTVGGSYSSIRTVAVAPSVTIAGSRTSLYLGGTVTFGTKVGPSHSGRAVVLQRWNGKAWQTVATRTLSSTSTASVAVRPPARGYSSYRWYIAAHTDHAAAVSPTFKVLVR